MQVRSAGYSTLLIGVIESLNGCLSLFSFVIDGDLPWVYLASHPKSAGIGANFLNRQEV